jgi:hypothetical protein
LAVVLGPQQAQLDEVLAMFKAHGKVLRQHLHKEKTQLLIKQLVMLPMAVVQQWIKLAHRQHLHQLENLPHLQVEVML